MPGIRQIEDMTTHHAKELIGRQLEVTFTDRLGNERVVTGYLLEVEFVPMYGTKLIFDTAEIAIERVVNYSELEVKRAA